MPVAFWKNAPSTIGKAAIVTHFGRPSCGWRGVGGSAPGAPRGEASGENRPEKRCAMIRPQPAKPA